MVTFSYEYLCVTQPKSYVFHVSLNRPSARNAMHGAIWDEMKDCFNRLDAAPECRCIILSGEGVAFCAGIDLNYAASGIFGTLKDNDVGRGYFHLHRFIKKLQATFSAIEDCRQPVIAVVHGACIGAGVDMITACDIRLFSSDAWLSVKEIDIGMAADVGTLQRLPRLVKDSGWVREVCYTGRRVSAFEASAVGLAMSTPYASKADAFNGALRLAELIAAKSPLAIAGIKRHLNFATDHTIQEGLEAIAMWNAGALQGGDLEAAAAVRGENGIAHFSNL